MIPNCPYGSGSHSQDAAIVKPVFLDENLIEVEFYADNSVNVNGFELFRSEDGVNFQYTDWTNSNPVLFQDTDVSTQLQSYSYYVNVIDSCNRIAANSNVAKSIFLFFTLSRVPNN